MNAEKMIPKKVLLAALHEIRDAAVDPATFAAAHNTGAERLEDARAFCVGWIESSASHALGLTTTLEDQRQVGHA